MPNVLAPQNHEYALDVRMAVKRLLELSDECRHTAGKVILHNAAVSLLVEKYKSQRYTEHWYYAQEISSRAGAIKQVRR
jgi:hypothetical protein